MAHDLEVPVESFSKPQGPKGLAEVSRSNFRNLLYAVSSEDSLLSRRHRDHPPEKKNWLEVKPSKVQVQIPEAFQRIIIAVLQYADWA